ncbi:peptide deformylase [Pseudalkalibacillus berkeleyi]|uniref:Peptide deformylase n=1 Tax=Pseudalkalibacillus berkeleyi TaxID=1069813 RepID=A0ABS9GVU9_9BACL|nr:peptide deformylase [Pseudalkalibacillus berkeleyi]MCF6136937.1 peptide deformylase [Pseudalkalibacillus berkeleyi]
MITMNDVVKEGASILRERAEAVPTPPSEEDRNTLAKMHEFLVNSQDPDMSAKYNLRPGIGIAAPQIGVGKRMIAVLVEDEDGKLYSYALFNPKIVSHSVQQSYLEGGEGCLSVDRDVPGFVPRYHKVKIKATDLDGKDIELRLKGLPSIVFQHEIDHLNGVMFYDHINKEDPFERPDGIAIGR